MKIKVFHTLTSLIFCAVSLYLLDESAQYGFLSSLGLSLLLGLVQRGVWLASSRRACISYSLAFVPPCLFEIALVHFSPLLYAAGALCALIYISVPSRRLPVSRPSTSLWLGSLVFMFETALLAGILA